MISEPSFKNRLLISMERLGFSRQSLASEKDTKCLSPILSSAIKRLDLLYCYSREGRMEPLLLIECKTKESFWRKAKRQVANYNYFIQSPFIAVACPGRLELTSPKEELQDALSLLREISFSEYCLGLPWWQGIPPCSKLRGLLEKYHLQ
ncbi:hypothetical protein HAT2_00105 [Candidatus Similichlamydia laticola]|uniref:Uncharacterized protein n=1 Tax=Candidatus Similichlamydia laticola TaxID=2170265 RepID=A0A369KG93_9BACT|nr:hypothetical protein HAT2_00105 [Candidatus Similichlamydia laticola]